MSVQIPAELVEAIAKELTAQIIPLVREELEAERSPWMNFEETAEYARMAHGTLREWTGDGRIPSHGGKRKLYHREEVDRALGYVARA